MSHAEDAPGDRTRTIRDVLIEDHRRLNRIFDDLSEAARAGVDTISLHEIWRSFEVGLRAHLEAEETLLLPRLGHRHPAMMRRILEEHRDIRERLDRLAVDVDLHTIRDQEIEELLSLLEVHADREDRTLYRWPEAMMRAKERRSLVGRLIGRLRS